MGTAIICIILVVVCIFGIKSYCKKLANGCCGSEVGSIKRTKPKDRNSAHYPYHYKIYVEGMSCKNCARKLQLLFDEQTDFSASVNFKKKTADVRAKQAVREEVFRSIVEKAGYFAIGIEKV